MMRRLQIVHGSSTSLRGARDYAQYDEIFRLTIHQFDSPASCLAELEVAMRVCASATPANVRNPTVTTEGYVEEPFVVWCVQGPRVECDRLWPRSLPQEPIVLIATTNYDLRLSDAREPASDLRAHRDWAAGSNKVQLLHGGHVAGCRVRWRLGSRAMLSLV